MASGQFFKVVHECGDVGEAAAARRRSRRMGASGCRPVRMRQSNSSFEFDCCTGDRSLRELFLGGELLLDN